MAIGLVCQYILSRIIQNLDVVERNNADYFHLSRTFRTFAGVYFNLRTSSISVTSASIILRISISSARRSS